MITRLRARLLFVTPTHVLAPGEVSIDADGRIVELRPCRGPAPDVALLPGLVNAHAHLQLQPLPRPVRQFLPWVRAVMAQRGRDATTHAATATTMLQRLAATGTTAVGEIDSTGHSPAVLQALGFSGRCYQELIGFDLAAAAARQLVKRRRLPGSRDCPAGLSPHAPYSVSADLFAAAARACRHLQVHTAELPEEVEFLANGRGPFRDLLQSLGRLPAGFRAPRTTAIEVLARRSVLRRGTALVHCQHLEPGAAERIAAAGAAIVVCPGTIRWFRREAPPVPQWLALGIPVALGTDSHASNEDLSMLRELRLAAQLWPGLTPQALLQMATVHGASALGRPGLGRLRLRGRADLLQVSAGTASPRELLSRFAHGEMPIERAWLAGRCVSGTSLLPVC